MPAWSWTRSDDHGLHTIVVGGRRVRYLERGAGEPVVLVHGLGGSWRWWSRNIDALAECHRVYALDLGRREHWHRGHTRVRPAEAAVVLTGWLDAVGLARAHLVGHSLGGSMAMRLAAMHPERVGRLVLVDAAGLLHGASLLGLTARALGPAPERTLEFRRIVVTDTLRTNPLVVLQTARDMVRDDLTDHLSRIVAPTLIVWGGRDHVVPVADAYALRDRIAGARLLVVPHAGHNPMYHHAGTFNRVVLDFLAGR